MTFYRIKVIHPDGLTRWNYTNNNNGIYYDLGGANRGINYIERTRKRWNHPDTNVYEIVEFKAEETAVLGMLGPYIPEETQ